MIDTIVFQIKLRVIRALVQPGDTLDVGCGDKKYTVHLPNPTGIDAYKECGGILADPDIWKDARDLKFPSGTFDNVCFFDVLEHILDAEVAIKEAWRVLKPGGILAIIDPNDSVLFWARLLCLRLGDAFRGRRTKKSETEDSPGHINQFNESGLVKLVEPLFKLEKVMRRGVFTGYRFRRK